MVLALTEIHLLGLRALACAPGALTLQLAVSVYRPDRRDHAWHMEKLAELCRAGDGLLPATPYKRLDVTNSESVDDATRWWEDLTSRKGEGMVVEQLEFIVRDRRGLTHNLQSNAGGQSMSKQTGCADAPKFSGSKYWGP
jgi:hypothetical protein